MSKYRLSKRSTDSLKGVHPLLSAVVVYALSISEVDFSVVDGLRTIAEQQSYVKSGASKTMDSYHLTGHAVDIYPWVNGKTSHNESDYLKVRDAMIQSAKQLGVDIQWGGNWKTFVDRPHWQIPRSYT